MKTLYNFKKKCTPKKLSPHYRPSTTEAVNSLLDKVFILDEEEEDAVSDKRRLATKAGCFGLGRLMFSVASIITTFDIVGLSFGSSCTHSRPIFIHFKTSVSLKDEIRIGSIISSAFSSIQNFHA